MRLRKHFSCSIHLKRAVAAPSAPSKPKFRNLGIVLVLIVVLVLGALAFCAGKDPICPAIILFRLPDCKTFGFSRTTPQLRSLGLNPLSFVAFKMGQASGSGCFECLRQHKGSRANLSFCPFGFGAGYLARKKRVTVAASAITIRDR